MTNLDQNWKHTYVKVSSKHIHGQIFRTHIPIASLTWDSDTFCRPNEYLNQRANQIAQPILAVSPTAASVQSIA